MKTRANDHGVKSLLIMCDNEGNLGDPNKNKRNQAVENHYKWAEGIITSEIVIIKEPIEVRVDHIFREYVVKPLPKNLQNHNPHPSI